MNTFNSYNEAKLAADKFFLENFGYKNGASRDSPEHREKDGTRIIEFYSVDDPAMDDTFTVFIKEKQYAE